ncbi:MAG: GNAT family protein [Candidatus Nomurabacteria bacterium]|nr:GNAT family protein [Candidatus Nomurabacteria bacterium]
MQGKSPYVVKVDSDIELRIRTENEAEELFNLIQNNKEHLGKFLYWINKANAFSYIKEFAHKYLIGYEGGTSCDFGIYFKDKMIGSGGFHRINQTHKKGEIEYWISEEYEGRGIVTKAVQKIIEIGREKYNLHRIVIMINTENEESKAIPKKLGFKYEGTMEYDKYINGKFISTEIWSLILCPVKKEINNKTEDHKCNGK